MKFFSLIFLFLFFASTALANTITLTTKNSASLVGEVDARSFRMVTKDLSALIQLRRSCNTPIYLILDTPGGSIYWGTKLISYAESICNLHTISLYAASMGSAIAQQLPGNRYVTRTSVVMFHRASAGISGQVGSGELESRLRFVQEMVKQLEVANSSRIGISLEDYQKKVKDEWWAYGKEAVDNNMADEVVSVKCSTALQKKTFSRTYQTMLGPVTVENSKCPLL